MFSPQPRRPTESSSDVAPISLDLVDTSPLGTRQTPIWFRGRRQIGSRTRDLPFASHDHLPQPASTDASGVPDQPRARQILCSPPRTLPGPYLQPGSASTPSFAFLPVGDGFPNSMSSIVPQYFSPHSLRFLLRPICGSLEHPTRDNPNTSTTQAKCGALGGSFYVVGYVQPVSETPSLQLNKISRCCAIFVTMF